MRTYVAIAETLADYHQIKTWSLKKKTSVKIIALSLEVLDGLAEVIHVWSLLPMDDILYRSYEKAQSIGQTWEAWFSHTDEGLFDAAARFQLTEELWYHAIVSEEIAQRLGGLFKKNGWTYLEQISETNFCGAYAPKRKGVSQQSMLFKLIAAEVFRSNLIPVKTTSWFMGLKRRASGVLLWKQILFIGVLSVVEYIHTRVVNKQKLSTILSTFQDLQNVRLVTVGWGKDLKRTFDYTAFNNEASHVNIPPLHLIYRSKNIVGCKKNERRQAVFIREWLFKGVAYGASVSMFGVGIFFRLLLFCVTTINLRWKRLVQESKQVSIFRYSVVRNNTKQLIFFSYRAAFLEQEILRTAFSFVPNASLFLGSDSGAAVARMSLLFARRSGYTTIDVPHSLRVYATKPYEQLAQLHLTLGEQNSEMLRRIGVPNERILSVGISHPRPSPKAFPENSPVRIVIGTRSRGGLWSNYASKHDTYQRELELLIDQLLTNERFHITIKSHPNGDYVAYYDSLVADRGADRLSHISSGWKFSEFVSSTDILVCMGEAPSFFVDAYLANIPVVFLEGTMSQVQKTMQYAYHGAAIVVDEAIGAVQAIRLMTKNETTYAAAVTQQSVRRRSIDGGDHPEETFFRHLQKSE